MYANDDSDNGNGRDGHGGSDSNSDDAAAAADGNDVDEDYSGDLRTVIGQWQFEDINGTTTMYIDNDGNGSDDGDGNSDSKGDGDGNGNDDATATNGKDVNEDNSGNSRTTIGQWQLDDNNGTMTMRWQWAAGNMQNTCKCCAIHQSNNQLM